jgi:hypothetical protein
MKSIRYLPLLLSLLAAPVLADTGTPQYTVSGISSGGFMAAQMGVIYSDRVAGVGTVAGGVFFCSKDHFPIKFNEKHSAGLLLTELNGSTMQSPEVFLLGSISDYLKKAFRIAPDNPIHEAVGICMAQPELAHAPQGSQTPGSKPPALMDLGFMGDFAEQGLIADPNGIANQKIFVYHGEKDDVVGVAMQDKMKEFYTRYGVSDANLKLERGTGGHNFPTTRNDGIDCDKEAVPYIANCGNDIAGKILKHTVSGDLTRGTFNVAHLYRINQMTSLHTDSVAAYGYLYASPKCLAQPDSCRLHIALHGCKMSDSFDQAFQTKYEEKLVSSGIMYVTDEEISNQGGLVGTAPLSLSERTPRFGALRFALDSGYGEYAESNDLMILFPQTQIRAKNYPLNPKGCWDWFGWTQTDDTRLKGNGAGRLYATNRGYEARWLNDYATLVQTNPKSMIVPWENKVQDIGLAKSIKAAE